MPDPIVFAGTVEDAECAAREVDEVRKREPVSLSPFPVEQGQPVPPDHDVLLAWIVVAEHRWDQWELVSEVAGHAVGVFRKHLTCYPLPFGGERLRWGS